MTSTPMPDRLVPSSALPCPECLFAGREGDQRIGNSRGLCKTCNRFVQSVIRRTQKLLRERYPREFAVLRAQVEKDLYPNVVADWSVTHPVSQAEITTELGL